MLIQQLRRVIADPTARSFRVVGDDFHGLTFADLKAAAAEYDDALRVVPSALRETVKSEHEAHAREVQLTLRASSRDVYQRVRGYLAVAQRTGFELVWPTVAALGISQILAGAGAYRLVSLLGEYANALGYDGVSELSAAIDDMVRRANRSIYADSISTSLFALRCVALRRSGRSALADALLAGPPPLTMDEQSWRIVRSIDLAASIDDGKARFTELARIAFDEFEREQAALTYHLDGRLELRGAPDWIQKRLRIQSVTLPVIEGGRLSFRKELLPDGFDLTDHRARVEGPGRAFFDAVTQSPEAFRATVAYVVRRFGRVSPHGLPVYGAGGLPLETAPFDD
ncbi:MAG: hypothetical protein HOV80_33225 [Polyangiaceae bacterium]|nr:hypothetical protein [Polyangiaceae bacterium]